MLGVGPHRGQKAYGGVQDPAQILARMAHRTHCVRNIVERGDVRDVFITLHLNMETYEI